MTQRLSGTDLSKRLRQELKERVASGMQKIGRAPGLATVLVGEDPASEVYVRNKRKACEETGMRSIHHALPKTTTEAELVSLIESLNRDPGVDGILVQLPLPKEIDADRALRAIDPSKDVDGFHPVSLGNLLLGQPGFLPCTPFGVMRLLETVSNDWAGKHAVVVGRSNIVGKPVSLLLLQKDMTVTVCHSRTRDLPAEILRADVVIAALGRPEFIQGEWIKPGAVVIDVGINRLADGRLVGDVDYDKAALRAAAITPVPGGVGPMTIAMLLWNTLDAYTKRESRA